MKEILFELTNEQRKCFGITPVLNNWVKILLKRSPYDNFDSFAYVEDGVFIKKLITVSEKRYEEYTLNETISEDGVYLLPKTEKGKPVKLSSATLLKRTSVGMVISYNRWEIYLYNRTSDQGYYRSRYYNLSINGIAEFKLWVEKWCNETGKEELAEIEEFAARKKVRQKFSVGDFFRIRLDRHVWAYGRIMLNFVEMRKKKEEFWDIYMSTPLIIAIYHKVTSVPISDIEELAGLKMLPAQQIFDNIFLYGEAEIIGNKPLLPSEEDYPVNYGKSHNIRENILYLQYGKLCKKLENTESLFPNWFENGGCGWNIDTTIPVLFECIKTNSNAPYWNESYYRRGEDLRNPKYQKELEAVFKQFGLDARDYIKDGEQRKKDFRCSKSVIK